MVYRLRDKRYNKCSRCQNQERCGPSTDLVSRLTSSRMLAGRRYKTWSEAHVGELLLRATGILVVSAVDPEYVMLVCSVHG